jgi:hypothetical protein
MLTPGRFAAPQDEGGSRVARAPIGVLGHPTVDPSCRAPEDPCGNFVASLPYMGGHGPPDRTDPNGIKLIRSAGVSGIETREPSTREVPTGRCARCV